VATEQLGTGGDGGNRIPGDLIVGGGVAFNGVTSVPSAPTITTLPTTATTADLEAIGVAVNSLISALEALGLAVAGSGS